MNDELEALQRLTAAPTPDSWTDLVRLWRAVRAEGRLTEELLDRSAKLLEGWPDELRVAPDAWCAALYGGWGGADDVEPELRLARVLDGLGGRHITAARALVERFAGSPEVRGLSRLLLHVREPKEILEALLLSPNLSSVRHLELEGSALGADRAFLCETLAAASHLKSLKLSARYLEGERAASVVGAHIRALELGAGSTQVLPAILASPELELERLTSWDNLTRPDFLALCHAPGLRTLRELHLHRVSLKEAELDVLGSASFIGGLEALSIGTEAPLSGIDLRRLRRLTLNTGALWVQTAPRPDLEFIARLPLLELSLGLNAASCRELVRWMNAASLRKLTLSGITAKGAAAIASSSWPALEELQLLGSLGAEGLLKIFSSTGMQALRSLTVSSSGSTAKHVLPAIPALAHGGLRALTLQAGRGGDPVCEAVASCDALSQLEELSLRALNATAAGARALAGSGLLTKLRSLDLSGSKIGDEGAEAIAGAPSLAGLRHLDLSYAGITDRGAKAIAAGLPNLRTLKLVSNKLRAEGAIALCKHPTLERLDVMSNAINLASRDRQLAGEVCKGGNGQLERLDLRNDAKGRNSLSSEDAEVLDHAGLRGVYLTAWT